METLSERFLVALTRNSVEAGVLVLVVFAAQWLCAGKIAARWRCALWLVVMARLLLPVSIGSAVSLFNLVPRWGTPQRASAPKLARSAASDAGIRSTSTASIAKPVPQVSDYELRPEVAADVGESIEPQISQRPINSQIVAPISSTKAPTGVSRPLILFGVWLAGAVLFGVYLMLSSFQISRRFAKLKPVTDAGLLDLLRDCRERLGVRGGLSVSESPEIASPALYGFLKPRLLLPPGFIDRFSVTELRFILLHELAHVKRRDILFNWLAAVLQIIHWFNPLIWFAFARWRADREPACDALALEAAGGDQNREYGRTILRLVENFTPRAAVPGLVGILEDKRQLQWRIRLIASFRPGRKFGLVSAALFAGIGLIGLTDAQMPKAKMPVDSTHAAAMDKPPEQAREIWRGGDPAPMAGDTNASTKTLTVTVTDAETGAPVADAEVSAPFMDIWEPGISGLPQGRPVYFPAGKTTPAYIFFARGRIGTNLQEINISMLAPEQKGDKQPRIVEEIKASGGGIEITNREIFLHLTNVTRLSHDGTSLRATYAEMRLLLSVGGTNDNASIDDITFSQPRRLTDAQGRYVLRIPAPPESARRQMDRFSVSANQRDYAPHAIRWTSDRGDVDERLPQAAAIKLEHGLTIGGVVHDDRGVPVVGVRVLLSGAGYRGFSVGTSEVKSHDYPEIDLQDKEHPAAVTDSAGRWTFGHFPSDLESVEITLVRPNESREAFSTTLVNPLLRKTTPISLADLRATNAEFTLPDGITVRGAVVDESGHPLVGVRIQEGYGCGNMVRVSEFTTDSRGRFERLNRAPRQWIYTASADDRATVSVVAQVASNMAEVRIVMPPAKPLKIRVTDGAGKPASGAKISVMPDHTEGQILDWKEEADANGLVVWTNAPAAKVAFIASHKSLGDREFRAGGIDGEKVVVLGNDAGRKVAVQVRAVDANTGAPLKIKSIAINYDGLSFKTRSEPNRTNASVEISAADFQVGMAADYRVKVDVEGYEPFVTDRIALLEGDQNIVAAMPAGGALDGMAFLPNGKPAAGAKIWVREGRFSWALVCNAPGQYYGDRMTKANADNNGKFTLPAVTGDPPVVFTADDGLLETTYKQVQHAHEARLRPWGGVKGVLKIAGQPKSGAKIALRTLSRALNVGYNLIYSATTGSDGGFEFTNVPAGEYILFRWPSTPTPRPVTEDHPIPLMVKAGETTQIDYSNSGRSLIGRAVPDKPDTAVNWLNDDHALTLKQPVIPSVSWEDFTTVAAFKEAQYNSLNSPQRLQQAREARTYGLNFEPDGSFRADDIPPGTYELNIRVTKPGTDMQYKGIYLRPEDELGSISREVVVPPGDAPFDLGKVVVPMKGNGKGPARVDFNAQTLDGKAVSLAQFKGKYVLLVFWAMWSDPSLDQLAEFKMLQQHLNQDDRLAFVGVCLDGESDAIQKAVAGRGYDWMQTRLNSADLAYVKAMFDVDSLPAIYLIDPEGRIIAHHLGFPRMLVAAHQALSKK